MIEAVFYRERHREITVYPRGYEEPGRKESAQRRPAAPEVQGTAPPSDDYAATGMGGRTSHEIELTDIDLETRPIASVRIRYEFRHQLVKLGVLPRYEPLERRERARGFESYCPER